MNNEFLPKPEEIRYTNEFYDIDTLPLKNFQKEMVLEYLAQKLWRILIRTDILESHCKSYDPLLIEGTIAHSYVFDMKDGGRHHGFKDYKDLETMLMDETINHIKNKIDDVTDFDRCKE